MQVIVEVKGDPVAVVESTKGRRLSDAERKTVRDNLSKKQDKVAKTITGKGGRFNRACSRRTTACGCS